MVFGNHHGNELMKHTQLTVSVLFGSWDLVGARNERDVLQRPSFRVFSQYVAKVDLRNVLVLFSETTTAPCFHSPLDFFYFPSGIARQSFVLIILWTNAIYKIKYAKRSANLVRSHAFPTIVDLPCHLPLIGSAFHKNTPANDDASPIILHSCFV